LKNINSVKKKQQALNTGCEDVLSKQLPLCMKNVVAGNNLDYKVMK
jgi:hypothetical protein